MILLPDTSEGENEVLRRTLRALRDPDVFEFVVRKPGACFLDKDGHERIVGTDGQDYPVGPAGAAVATC